MLKTKPDNPQDYRLEQLESRLLFSATGLDVVVDPPQGDDVLEPNSAVMEALNVWNCRSFFKGQSA